MLWSMAMASGSVSMPLILGEGRRITLSRSQPTPGEMSKRARGPVIGDSATTGGGRFKIGSVTVVSEFASHDSPPQSGA